MATALTERSMPVVYLGILSHTRAWKFATLLEVVTGCFRIQNTTSTQHRPNIFFDAVQSAQKIAQKLLLSPEHEDVSTPTALHHSIEVTEYLNEDAYAIIPRSIRFPYKRNHIHHCEESNLGHLPGIHNASPLLLTYEPIDGHEEPEAGHSKLTMESKSGANSPHDSKFSPAPEQPHFEISEIYDLPPREPRKLAEVCVYTDWILVAAEVKAKKSPEELEKEWPEIIRPQPRRAAQLPVFEDEEGQLREHHITALEAAEKSFEKKHEVIQGTAYPVMTFKEFGKSGFDLYFDSGKEEELPLDFWQFIQEAKQYLGLAEFDPSSLDTDGNFVYRSSEWHVAGWCSPEYRQLFIKYLAHMVLNQQRNRIAKHHRAARNRLAKHDAEWEDVAFLEGWLRVNNGLYTHDAYRAPDGGIFTTVDQYGNELGRDAMIAEFWARKGKPSPHRIDLWKEEYFKRQHEAPRQCQWMTAAEEEALNTGCSGSLHFLESWPNGKGGEDYDPRGSVEVATGECFIMRNRCLGWHMVTHRVDLVGETGVFPFDDCSPLPFLNLVTPSTPFPASSLGATARATLEQYRNGPNEWPAYASADGQIVRTEANEEYNSALFGRVNHPYQQSGWGGNYTSNVQTQFNNAFHGQQQVQNGHYNHAYQLQQLQKQPLAQNIYGWKHERRDPACDNQHYAQYHQLTGY